jgi:hypothetical protein
MTFAMLAGYGFLLYVAIGACVAAAFVIAGVHRVLLQPTSFTPAARLLLLPGAAALWPYVLLRWLRSPG